MCGLYYHVEFVDLSSDESVNFEKSGRLESWKGVECKGKLSSTVTVVRTHLPISSNNLADPDHVCDCFQHLKILTDQVYELSCNQTEMRKQLSNLQDENSKLKAFLSPHVDTITISKR